MNEGRQAAEAHRRSGRRRQGWIVGLAGLTLAAIVLGIMLGAFALSPATVMRTLIDPTQSDPTTRLLVWNLRLPYAVFAALVGMALGLAGAETQTVLDNPLASPFTLGVASAAALGAALAIVVHASLPGLPLSSAIAVNAFIFALACTVALDIALRRSHLNGTGVILLGVALVFAFNALLSLLQFMASASALQDLAFWTMGDLSRAGWTQIGALACVVALALFFSLRQAWALTALRLGEARALGLGVDVRRLRRMALARVSLLVGLSVAFAGTIGFIGLAAPHLARRLFGEDHRYYLPGSALIGALLLSAAALLARVLVHDTPIPVGIITALLGIPFFLAAIWRRPG